MASAIWHLRANNLGKQVLPFLLVTCQFFLPHCLLLLFNLVVFSPFTYFFSHHPTIFLLAFSLIFSLQTYPSTISTSTSARVNPPDVGGGCGVYVDDSTGVIPERIVKRLDSLTFARKGSAVGPGTAFLR